MPQLSDILAKRPDKKFVKRNVRPYDYSGSGALSSSEILDNSLQTAEAADPSKNLLAHTEIHTPIPPTQEKTKDRKSSQELSEVHRSSQKLKTAHKGSNKSSLESNYGSNNKDIEIKNNGDLTSFEIQNLLKRLGGNERTLFFLIVNWCSINETLSTGEIYSETLDESLQMPRNSRETAIKRLNKKGLIIRERGKRGANGIIALSITEVVKKEALCFLSTNQAKYNLLLTYNKNHQGLPINRVQQECEISLSSSFNKTTTELPAEWGNLQLAALQDILNTLSATTKKPQFFGIAEVKRIYSNVGNILTAKQLQDTIDHFTYGLKNHLNDEPYVTMENPGAILYKKLINGDVWLEPRYLTPEETMLRTFYLNIRSTLDKDISVHFQKWFNEEKEEKRKYYQKSLPSTHFFDERVFYDLASKDYENRVWHEHRKSIIVQMMGDQNIELLNKFELMDKLTIK